MTTRTFAGTMIYPNGDPIPNLPIYIKAVKSHPIGSDDLVQWHESEFATDGPGETSGQYSITVSLGTYEVYCEDLESSDSKRFYLGKLIVAEETGTTLSLLEAMELSVPPYSWLFDLREHDNTYHSADFITVADVKVSNLNVDIDLNMAAQDIFADGYSIEGVNGTTAPHTVGRMILRDTNEDAFVRLGGDSDASAVVPLHQFIKGKISLGHGGEPEETLDVLGNLKIDGGFRIEKGEQDGRSVILDVEGDCGVIKTFDNQGGQILFVGDYLSFGYGVSIGKTTPPPFDIRLDVNGAIRSNSTIQGEFKASGGDPGINAMIAEISWLDVKDGLIVGGSYTTI